MAGQERQREDAAASWTNGEIRRRRQLQEEKEGFGNSGRKEEEDEDAAVADEWLVGICVCLKNIMVR